MALKRVVFEIDVEAETNIEAAKTVQEWLDAGTDNWQFYVQDVKTLKIVSVDLNEHKSCMESEVNNYIPMIKLNKV